MQNVCHFFYFFFLYKFNFNVIWSDSVFANLRFDRVSKHKNKHMMRLPSLCQCTKKKKRKTESEKKRDSLSFVFGLFRWVKIVLGFRFVLWKKIKKVFSIKYKNCRLTYFLKNIPAKYWNNIIPWKFIYILKRLTIFSATFIFFLFFFFLIKNFVLKI